MADKTAEAKFMNDDKIAASNLAAAIMQATGQAHATPEAAAKLYFACVDALAAETKDRPKGAPSPTFGSY